MTECNKSTHIALLASSVLATASSGFAAEVTSERLIDANREPHNWLMNHRTYDGQRFSPLARITKDNVKNLKLVYAVPLGGSTGNEWLEATALVEEGFLYITDAWGVLYKIDVRSGDVGRIVWRMEPKQERPQTNRGAALWGNFVITAANWPARIVATDNATGKLLWRKFTIPAPGEPGSETWKGNTNAWQTGGAAVWVTGTYDPTTNQTFWGTGNPVPMFDPFYRPGDNLYTNSAISWNPETGKMNWYFQYTPGDIWDYDEVGTHILIDGNVGGQQRKLVTHSARNGFLYTMERANGAIVAVKPYMDNVNWTKGIDPKTGKPVDYDPNKDIQTYAGMGNLTPGAPLKRVCPSQAGGNNYFPSSYSQRSKLIYIPALTACVNIAIDREKHNKEKGWNGGLSTTDERWESSLTAVDPISGEVKKSIQLRYPNYSGTLATAGGVIFLALLDGTIAAYDETTLDELWKVNMGAGFTAPPMTFEVNGRQYVAIASGASPVARAKLVNTLELRDQRQATVLYVFGL